MPYSYSYSVRFICSLFDMYLLARVIPLAEAAFNGLPRRKGKRKRISVQINQQKHCLDIRLDSERYLDQCNLLRAAQYFCKILSKQVGMQNYIVGGRLLTQI